MNPRRRSEPQNILSAWMALEVLSPQIYERPDDLKSIGGSVAWLQDSLPWEGKGESSPSNKRLYYHLVLGALDLKATTVALLSKFTDKNIDRSPAKGKVPIAYIALDQSGILTERDAIALSSFAWGVPKVLRREFKSLAGWPAAEAQILRDFEKKIYHKDDKGRASPLSGQHIRDAYSWLSQELDLPATLIDPPSFALRVYHHVKDDNPPETPLLNSFFFHDLGRAKELADQGKLNRSLRLYFAEEHPQKTYDLLADTEVLESSLAPAKAPPACWPAKGHHPLVLLQQAAVNLSLLELSGKTGIFSVNGPPGTGKTTLLRDLVAALVTQRAEQMASFDDPEAAFQSTGMRVQAGAGFWTLHKLAEKLKGHEIIVASSNNNAVENVSKELPVRDAIATDMALQYFRTVSDNARGLQTWGLISAALGNSTKRREFRNTVWDDKDKGLSVYLKAATGAPTRVEADGIVRLPLAVTSENPPTGKDDALARWQASRRAFLIAKDEAQKALESLEELRQASHSIHVLQADVEAAKDSLSKAEKNLHIAKAAQEGFAEDLALAEAQAEVTQTALAAHAAVRPRLSARLIRTVAAKEWKAAYFKLRADDQKALHALSVKKLEGVKINSTLQRAKKRHGRCAAAEKAANQRLTVTLMRVQDMRDKLPVTLLDNDFFAQDHETKHKASPWFAEEVHRLRERVFAEAMNLHRAFVDAAAKPLRHNIGTLIGVMGGGDLGLPEKTALLPDLWASLFLVIPVLSTTFASVGRMLRLLPQEAFGWLMIDEAGQAAPQAAVGALMRTKRAIVVGDPMQIPPVVTLPSSLSETICLQFNVNPEQWSAPDASAQTLADAASAYIAEFHQDTGTRKVGVPLLVHRRCQDPMFTISNCVAYSGLMVKATGARDSDIRKILGPSAWIDIEGSLQEKWCPEEGEQVIAMLQQLVRAGIEAPDIFIVTPFVKVKEGLQERLGKEFQLLLCKLAGDRSTRSHRKWICGRVGTVHTVQGREADSVIMVLGAPLPSHVGARAWAGGQPNLLNVAVSRAKENLYVLGFRKAWATAGHFKVLANALPAADKQRGGKSAKM